MNKKLKNIAITLVIVLIVLFSIEFSGIGKSGDIMIQIPQNSSISEIARILKENKLINNEFLFKVYSVISGSRYYSGEYYIQKAGYADLSDTLSVIPSERTVNVTFIEGVELREIRAKLAELKLCTEAEFDKYAKKEYYDYEFLKYIPARENELEGYLFPDTYNFSYSEGAKSIINKMLLNFENKVIGELEEDIYIKNLNLDEVIIMASILEREVADKDELSLVSGVFYNRLNQKGESVGLLESCATVQYILKERKLVLSVADTKIDSPYNTYKYKGLPVGPIASPGIEAIKAAVHPENTDYLYFVAGSDGKHYFSKTYAEHQQNMRKAGL